MRAKGAYLLCQSSNKPRIGGSVAATPVANAFQDHDMVASGSGPMNRPPTNAATPREDSIATAAKTKRVFDTLGRVAVMGCSAMAVFTSDPRWSCPDFDEDIVPTR